MGLIECVPNFSEGRRVEVLGALVAQATAQGVRVLDASLDPDHHRAVVTLAGQAERMGEAAFALIAEAARRIDLNHHFGEHPRFGATDVCPFIPLEGSSLADCAALAHAVGARVGAELAIPVFYYGEAARRPERRALPAVRRGGLRGLRAIGQDPAREPDDGPHRMHPTAGAVAIGARNFLIAFNVNLQTADVELARKIAVEVRESGGGLPGIRAIGLAVDAGRTAQVSMNVCDFARTGLIAAFDEVERLACEHGVAVRESELVGLAPRAALDHEIARHVRLRSFDPSLHVLEELLR